MFLLIKVIKMNIRKASIFILLFISFLWIDKVWAVFHNDSCWLELLPAFSPSTSIAQEYNIKNENYLSYNWINNENISTILSWYTNIEYLWRNTNSVFFIICSF